MNCKNCGKTIRRTNWYDGPGWDHNGTGPTCSPKWATPDEPACSACDKPVEILPSGVMVHVDGTGHEEWGNHRRLPVAQANPPAIPQPVEHRYEETLDESERRGD
jgi:hypothetical protein